MTKKYLITALITFSLILLVSLPMFHMPASGASLGASLNVRQASDNTCVIKNGAITIEVKEISRDHSRLTYINPNMKETTIVDIVVAQGEVILLVNEEEVARHPIKSASLYEMAAVAAPYYPIHYWWDGVFFVEGTQSYKYVHPDRDYYQISPYSSWSRAGYKLIYNQIDYATSISLGVGGPAVIGAAIGAIVGTCLVGPPHGTIVGAIVGAVLALVLTWISNAVWLDEKNCIWWWISLAFVSWLVTNAWWLAILGVFGGVSYVMSAFLSYGYCRVGSVTFYDAIGAGSPEPPRFMRSDQHTVNSLTAYRFQTTQSSVAKSTNNGYMGAGQTVYWRIQVWVRHASGSESELTSGFWTAVVSRSSNGEGIQSATWNCPETSLQSTDAIKVKVYVWIGPYPEAGSVTFITEPLGATKLHASTWRIYYYTKYYTDGRYATTGYFYWGTDQYSSCIGGVKTS